MNSVFLYFCIFAFNIQKANYYWWDWYSTLIWFLSFLEMKYFFTVSWKFFCKRKWDIIDTIIIFFRLVTEPSIVTQWPMVAEVMAGENVVLKCNIVELYSSCSTVAWLRINSENATISLTNRLQMDTHNSESVQSICTAVITNSTVHDSSIYYCAAVHGRFAHIGNGSRVIVKGEIKIIIISLL